MPRARLAHALECFGAPTEEDSKEFFEKLRGNIREDVSESFRGILEEFGGQLVRNLKEEFTRSSSHVGRSERRVSSEQAAAIRMIPPKLDASYWSGGAGCFSCTVHRGCNLSKAPPLPAGDHAVIFADAADNDDLDNGYWCEAPIPKEKAERKDGARKKKPEQRRDNGPSPRDDESPSARQLREMIQARSGNGACDVTLTTSEEKCANTCGSLLPKMEGEEHSAIIRFQNYLKNKTKKEEGRVQTKSQRLGRVSTISAQTPRLGICGRFADHQYFKCTSAMLIILNTIFIGVETDIGMRLALEDPPASDPHAFEIINIAFLAFFSLELLIRIVGFRLEFFHGEEASWNMFDTAVVLFSLVEALFLGDAVKMQSLRTLRLFRLVRTLRVVRVVRVFQRLKSMIICIMNGLVSLVWALILLFLLMYLFSIVCLQGAAVYLRDYSAQTHYEGDQVYGDRFTDDELRAEILTHYSNLPRSMVTLMMSITGGLDWYDGMRPLLQINPLYGALFVFFIMFIIFGVLNVLTGVFVEHALQIRDRDLVIQAEMEETDRFLHDMHDIFTEANTRGSEELSFEELSAYLSNERVVSYMATHQIDVSDIPLMFKILDSDGTGEIQMQEWLVGCMRLKGSAKCLDILRIFEALEVLQSQIHSVENSLNVSRPTHLTETDRSHGVEDAARGLTRAEDPAVKGNEVAETHASENPMQEHEHVLGNLGT
jgi:hypothetical protein